MCSMPGSVMVVEVVALALDEAVVLVPLDASGRCRRSRAVVVGLRFGGGHADAPQRVGVVAAAAARMALTMFM